MNKQIQFDRFYYLITCIIIFFSFFHHSSLYSPFLNADDGVVVLMIHDFHLPQDLYFWGANRFGSLVPLVGQFFYKILHFTPIQSEAITHYLLLIFGFLGYASLFKSKIIRLTFAIIWFLPPLRMIDILKVSQGEQYALIGIAVFCINKLYENPIVHYRFRENALLLLSTLIFIASIWVSDLAIITICIILLIYGYSNIRAITLNNYKSILKKPELYYIISGFFIGALFIYYAKTNAVKQEDFYSFFDPNILLASFKIFIGTIRDLMLFRINEPFTSLYAYLLLFGLLTLLLNYRKIKFKRNSSIWATIFIIDLALVFIVIISSKWAYLNGVPRRYFICNYASFWLFFLLAIENIQIIKFRKQLIGFTLITVIIGGLGTIYNYKYISPKSLKPTIETASELKSLGRIGIISEYWNSYINSAIDPDNIKATPNDKSFVRKQSYVDSVFLQPKIYVIRDMWMNSFPDTLEQFGYFLLKDGNEFRLANSQLCLYKKMKINKSFFLDQFSFIESYIVYDKEIDRNILKFTSDCIECSEKFVSYGPYIAIGIGKFSASFFIKSTNFTSDNSIAMLDVAANYGKTQLAARKISKSIFSTDKYIRVDLDFETTKSYTGIEFRIYYYGNADLYFDHLELNEK